VAIRCAFDNGAHVGETAAEFLQAFPNAQVHSFEPHPRAFFVLKEIMSDRLQAHCLAIRNKVVILPITTGEGGLPSSSSSLVGPTQSGLFSDHRTKKIKVRCQTVDQFCADYRIVSLDLVKTDTEGHEVEVLKGARETLLHRSVRFVFVEFNTILPIADGTAVLWPRSRSVWNRLGSD
jgi:FkbM family methyltransferase